MKKIYIILLFVFCSLISTCGFFNELLEPGDVKKLLQKDIIDTNAPIITLYSHTNGQEVGASYTLQGTVIDGESGVKAVYVRMDNGGYNPAPVILSNWSANISNSVFGAHTNYVYAVDNAGNLSAVQSVIVMRASIPVVTIIKPVNGSLTNISNITISGTSSIDAQYSISKVQVQLNGGAWDDASGTTNWTMAAFLSSGANTLKARAIGDNNKTNESTEIKVVFPFLNKFTAFDGEAGDSFGYSTAISADGNTVVIGAPNDDDKGSVYRLHWNGSAWVTNKFTAGDGEAGDQFGFSVAVSADGDTIVASAPNDDDKGGDSGSVYRFYLDGSIWKTNKFVQYDGSATNYFGTGVAVSADGNTIAVGVQNDDDKGFNSGSAYRFYLDGAVWKTNKFLMLNGQAEDWFGVSVAISADGNTVVVGANGDYYDQNMSGSVTRLQLSGTNWLTNTFFAIDGNGDEQLGFSVAVSADGNTVVGGAFYEDISGESQQGAVYRFHLSGTNWGTTKFIAPDGVTWDTFGQSVAVSADGDTVVAGAKGDDGGKGSVYWYKWNGSVWEMNKIIAYDGVANDYFGFSAAVSSNGSIIVTGAKGDDGGKGSVYRYMW